MKSWKKQWKAQLNETTPKLRQDVANQPINVTAAQNSGNAPSQTHLLKRKPFWYGLSSAVAVLLIVVLCVTLIPSGSSDVYAFVVEINPAVTVSADKDGKVTGIVASNADADVILSDADAVNGLKGKNVDEVVQWYVDTAAKLGYLNEDNPSAVRITTVDSGSKLLGRISAKVESYFMNRGVKSVVIADVTDLNTFAERANLNVKSSLKAVADCVQTSEPVYRNRGAESLSVDERKQTYQGYAESDDFVDGVGYYLNEIIDTIAQNEKDIDALVALSEQIEDHEGNPATIRKDYWTVKARYSTFADPQFAELMSQMDSAIERYNEAYGYDITSSWELDAAARTYSVISAEDLRSILSHFTVDFFKLHVDWLSDILQTVSADAPLAGLTTLPETAEEFVDKVRGVLTIERSSREKRFEEAYNKHREQISVSDYEAFKQSLFGKYGSSEELWNNLK